MTFDPICEIVRVSVELMIKYYIKILATPPSISPSKYGMTEYSYGMLIVIIEMIIKIHFMVSIGFG